MAYIYAYAPDEADCSTAGLVGALLDEDASFEQQAGEFGELSFTHPIDEWGKWRALADGVLLKTEVPVRLCPEIVNGAHVASVDVYAVSASATKAQRYVYSKPFSGARRDKKKKLLSAGTQVTVTLDVNPGDSGARYRVRAGKVTGYMEKAGLSLREAAVPVSPTHAGLDAVEASYAVRQQLFRVYEVAPQGQAGRASGVRVRARRIIYDLLGDNCHFVNLGSMSCQAAINGVLGSCAWPHDFSGHTDIGDSHIGFDARDISVLKALIDPEEGVAARWGAEVAVDDYDVYLLRRCGVDRGVRIEYGKNLTGIHVEADSSGAVTVLRPVGENADGTSLYLDGHIVNGRHGYNYSQGTCANWLPSGYRFLTNADGSLRDGSYVTRAANPHFAVDRCAVVRCADAKVDEKKKQKTGVSVALARVRMAEQAIQKFAAGCDSVQLSMAVDFVLLGDTEEYRQYKGLEPLFVYDTVHVRHGPLGIRADINLTRFEWLVRSERVSEADFGALRDVSASIASWQLPSGISGEKIIAGSIGAAAIKDDVINTRHLQAESVNADAIQAEAVTAGKLAAGAVTAGTIEAGAVTTAALAAQSVTAEKLAAGAVTAATIATQAITAEKLAAGAVDAQALSAVTAAIADLAAADITTSSLYAAFAHLMSLAAGSIQAGTVSADQLATQLATIVSLSSQIVDVGYARVKDLSAGTAIITDGEAGALRIERLAVTSANLLNAVIGTLVLPGTDGKYYAVRVGAGGSLATEELELTQEEIEAGVTADGRQILADEVNAQSLNASTVSARQAILGTILTDALTAGKITASEAVMASATVPALYATAITALGNSLDLQANQSVNILVGEALDAADAAQATADAASEAAIGITGAVEEAGPAAVISLEGVPAQSAEQVVVDIEPVQAGSGTPSPTNVRPITGWTGAQVTRTGKNLLGPIATGTRTHGGVTFTANADGSISLSGTASANVNYWLNTTNVNSQYRYPFVGQRQYTLSGCPSGGSASTYRLVGYADIGTTYANRALSDVGSGSSVNTSGVVFDSIRVMIDIKSGTVCDGLVFWPQIELGSAATDYEPYNGEIYSITFPTEAGTVCGGTLDVTAGKLTVESVLWTKNTSTMDNGEAYPGWRNAGVAAILGTGLNRHLTTVANIGNKVGINTTLTNDILYLVKDTYGKTETEWKALAMDVQVVLPLATPVTYDLTPQEIALLAGTNHLWADCGDVALKYASVIGTLSNYYTKAQADGALGDVDADVRAAQATAYLAETAATGARLAADTAQDAADAAQASADAAQATADGAEATAAQVRSVFSFSAEGLRTRVSNSKWSTLTAEDGFYIDHEDVPGHVGAFYQETFEPRSMRLGDVILRKTPSGGWSWKKV